MYSSDFFYLAQQATVCEINLFLPLDLYFAHVKQLSSAFLSAVTHTYVTNVSDVNQLR